MVTKISPKAFEHLVRTRHAEAYRCARRVLRSDAAAEDAVQEVFLQVLSGKIALEPHQELEHGRILRAWVIRIALNDRRGAGRRTHREQSHAMQRSQTQQAVPEDSQELWSFVEELPDSLRVPLVLRFSEGMAFAQIGAALGVAESTAHERVSSALSRLRQRLAQAGFAALAVGLEAKLAQASTPRLPEHLADRLLQIKLAPNALPLGAWIGACATALVLGAGALFWEPSPAEQATVESPAMALRELAADPQPSAGTPNPERREALNAQAASETPTQSWSGRVTGRVYDESGAPVIDAHVSVLSVERDGKFAAFGASTRTDRQGAFDVAIELPSAEGGFCTIQVVRAGYTIRTGEALRVRADHTAHAGDLRVQSVSGELAAPCRVLVEVRTSRGNAVPGALLELASVVDLPVAEGTQWSEWYSREKWLERIDKWVRTDDRGRVEIEAATSGSKLLRIKPAGTSWAPCLLRFDARPHESQTLVAILEPAGSIHGVLTTIDGPLAAGQHEGLQLFVRDVVASEWVFGSIAMDGSFAIEGLPAGVHRVEVTSNGAQSDPIKNPGWSPTEFEASITREQLKSVGHQVALKLLADPRAAGSHLAEIHAHLHRSEDAQPVAAAIWDVELVEAPAEMDAVSEKDWYWNQLYPRPVQRSISGPIPEPSDAIHFAGLRAGSYYLRFDIKDRAPLLYGPLKLQERELIAGLKIALPAPATLKGRILDAQGVPVDAACVFVTGMGSQSDELISKAVANYRQADGRGYLFINGSETRTKQGDFTLERLPGGRSFRVVVLHASREPLISAPLQLEAGEQRQALVLSFPR